MNSKNRKTLEAIFSQPTRTNIRWDDIKALLIAIGATVMEREGSRVRFIKDACGVSFHRPHPGKEAKPFQVEAVRDFLLEVRIKP